jgi:hypothetical protein
MKSLDLGSKILEALEAPTKNTGLAHPGVLNSIPDWNDSNFWLAILLGSGLILFSYWTWKDMTRQLKK